MIRTSTLSPWLSPLALLLASCGTGAIGESAPAGAESASATGELAMKDFGTFDQPWAAAFAPGTSVLFVTEKAGAIRMVDTATGKTGMVTGAPKVDYGGQGGLGDIAFLPAEAAATLGKRTIYLSWVEAGAGDTRGAVVGRGTLACSAADACAIEGLQVIWRQAPKVSGRGHYSHRIAVSPDGQHLFVASGERQKMEPAQDTTNTLGTIVRLNLDGSPAAGNPVAANAEIWSYGHRNILGMAFDDAGRLWEVEHGPAGGDELNLVKPGANYGWPVVSEGDHYDGKDIPPHASRPDLAPPAVSWTPVIAPGGMIIYRGALFQPWHGQALIAGLSSNAIVQVALDGEQAREVRRYEFDNRLRAIMEGPDGAVWVLEDGEGGRLIKLTPKG